MGTNQAMQMPTITDVPQDVIKDYILPHMDMKGLGSLSMVSAYCKDTCDDNEVWKREYMKTIRCVVTDKSKHHNYRCAEYISTPSFYSGWSLYKDMPPEEFVKRWKFYCLPSEVRDKIPSWSSVKEDHELDVFGTHTRPAYSRRRGNYLSSYAGPEEIRYEGIIKDVWTKHNRERGLSTVNLCQCQKHYYVGTLGVPESCRNFKSYKKMLLKKTFTVEKKKAPTILKWEDVQSCIKSYRSQIEQFERMIKETQCRGDAVKKDIETSQNLLDNLKIAIGSL